VGLYTNGHLIGLAGSAWPPAGRLPTPLTGEPLPHCPTAPVRRDLRAVAGFRREMFLAGPKAPFEAD